MMKNEKTCAIVLNGKVDIEITEDFIICADGGIDSLMGRSADVLIGDADSMKKVPEGIKFLKFPSKKNKTDGELCVDYAEDKGFLSLTFYGAFGGRLDHVLGNLNLLAYADHKNIKAVAKSKELTVYFVKENFSLAATKGDIFSILPFGESVLVEQSQGLFYELKNLKITQIQSGRGISNVAISQTITLKIASGTAFVFHYKAV